MPYAFGVENIGGNLYTIIKKKTDLPAKFTAKIKTVIDNQPRVHLKFYLGDRPIANLNKMICEIKLKIIKPEKKGQELDLEIRVNRSGDATIQLIHKVTSKSVCKK